MFAPPPSQNGTSHGILKVFDRLHVPFSPPPPNGTCCGNTIWNPTRLSLTSIEIDFSCKQECIPVGCVSPRIGRPYLVVCVCVGGACVAYTPPAMHAPQPCMPPCHTHPQPCMLPSHAFPLPCTPLPTVHRHTPVKT